MTKGQLIQLVKDAVGTQFSDRTIALKIGQVFTTICSQLFATNQNQFEYFSKRVKLPVVNRIATLDIPTIQTRENGNGIPRITPSEDYETIFYPSPAYSRGSSVDANKISGFVFYVVTGNEILFSKSLPESVTEVEATIIPEFQAWGDDEFINLPGGAAQMIIDQSIASVRNDPAHTNLYKSKA